MGLMINLIGWIGIAVMLSGIALRVWAAQTLGRFYARTLLVSDSQHVVQNGPHTHARHPADLGVILLWVGAGWATYAAPGSVSELYDKVLVPRKGIEVVI